MEIDSIQILHRFSVHFVCDACSDLEDLYTLASETVQPVFDHFAAHASAVVTVWRDKEGRLVADHHVTDDTQSRNETKRPWANPRNGYTFVRNVFPPGSLDETGTMLRCRASGCDFRKLLPKGPQDIAVRRTFSNSLLRHEAKCKRRLWEVECGECVDGGRSGSEGEGESGDDATYNEKSISQPRSLVSRPTQGT
jgi:hypothetical protein